jgi:hypothetical protein
MYIDVINLIIFRAIPVSVAIKLYSSQSCKKALFQSELQKSFIPVRVAKSFIPVRVAKKLYSSHSC